MKLFIYGSGGTGLEVLEIALKVNKINFFWDDIFFIDDFYEGKLRYGHKVLNFQDVLPGSEGVVAIGEPKIREEVLKKIYSKSISLTSVIDPTAVISSSATIHPGCIIYPGVIISSNTIIHDNVMIQFNTVVGHDIKVDQSSCISSNAAIGGNVVIGRECYIGMGAAIKEGLAIGDNSILAMNGALFSNLDKGIIAVGNPARPVKRNVDNQVFKS